MLKLNLNRIFSIFKKEIRFALRDSDIILTTFLLPFLIYPFITLISATFLVQTQKSIDKAQVDIVAPEVLRQYDKYLATDTVKVTYVKDTQKFIDSLEIGKIDALIEVATPSSNFHNAGSSESLGLKISYDMTSWKSEKAEEAITDSLWKLRKDLVSKRLEYQKLSEKFIKPIRIASKSIADPEKVGGALLGKTLPILLIMLPLMGAFIASVDLVAGERDRGTLETLLLTPVPFKEILLGKLIAIIAIILISVVVNLSCLGFMVKALSAQAAQYTQSTIALPTSISVIFLMLIAMLPFSASLGSLYMTLAFIAGSVKRAQTYLSPLIGIMILPAFMGTMPGIELTNLTATVPILNIALLFNSLLIGECTTQLFILTFVASIVHCCLILLFASSVFRREDILVQDNGDIAQLFRPVLPTQTSPTARASIYIFGFVFFLIYFLGEYFQNNSHWQVVTGLALIQIFIILAPPLAYLLFYRYKLVPTLNLEPSKIRLKNLFLISMLTLCMLVIVVQYSIIQDSFYPMPEDLSKIFSGLFTSSPIWWILIVVSLLAGFCEEILFRGFIQKGLSTRIGKWGALILASMMFGIFHITPYKWISTCLLGLWLGFVYKTTKSLWMSMFAHAFNNGVAALLLYYATKNQVISSGANQVQQVPQLLLFIAIIVFITLLPQFIKINRDVAHDTEIEDYTETATET